MSNPADVPPASLKKKKRKRSEGLDDPAFVHSPDETKKKKKKIRERDEDLEEISLLPPPEEETNIKKKKKKGVQKEEGERMAVVTPDHSIHMEEKGIAVETPDNNVHKKKKKKKKNEEEGGVAMVTPDNSIHMEKKKKRNDEEEIATVTPDNSIHTVEKKKKKKKKIEEEEEIAMATPDNSIRTEKKKKKKKKIEEEEEEITMATPDNSVHTVEKKKKKIRNEEQGIAMVTSDNSIHTEEEKKKKKKKKRNEEITMVTPDNSIHTVEKKKKKKKKIRNEEEEEEEIAMVTPDNSIHTVEKKKKKIRNEEEEEEIAMVTPDNSIHTVEKKKKKKKRDEEEIAMATPDNTIHTVEKKKKKKKIRSEEEEEIAMVTPDNSIHMEEKKKKQRKKVQNEEGRTVVDEPPSVVASPVVTKNKKKHKEGQTEEESIPMVTTDHNISMQEKNKKKKRKGRGEDVGVELTPSPDQEMEQKKSKDVHNEEESIAMGTTVSNHIRSQKKKQEENCVVMETSESGKKKKRHKNKHSITMVTTEKTVKSESLVPMDTGNSRKEDEEDDCTLEITEMGVKNITTVTKKKNRGSEHLEKNQTGQVAIETADVEQQTETYCKQEDTQMETISQNNREGTLLETWDASSDTEAQDLQELQEFIPDLKKKSVNVINKLILYDLPRFREFKKKGVAVRRGRFSEEENQQIRDNLNDFLVLTGTNSIEELMFPQRFKNQEAEIKKLRKNHRYILKIAEGIPRPCLQVLVRAKKMMDPRNHMGRFTEDEVHALTKLHTLHGNDWKTIAEKMNRSTGAVLKRFATTGGVQGAWSPDEVFRLKCAIEHHLKIRLKKCPSGSGLTRQQLCVNLPWTKISLAVESRTWYQCRLKWFSILKRRLEGERTPLSDIQNRINIINTLFDMNVKESRDIDWMKVASAIGAATPVYAQKTFRRMKYSTIANWKNLSYGEIVDILREKELPRLQILLDTLRNKRKQMPGHRQMQDSYQLSEIFPESDDHNSDDSQC